jgi:signal-transduction protein with cAMP-binding, CBS, and nucleotidyltransferase domain
MMAVDALQLMKKHNITQVVVAEKGKYLGFVHLHDLLGKELSEIYKYKYEIFLPGTIRFCYFQRN